MIQFIKFGIYLASAIVYTPAAILLPNKCIEKMKPGVQREPEGVKRFKRIK